MQAATLILIYCKGDAIKLPSCTPGSQMFCRLFSCSRTCPCDEVSFPVQIAHALWRPSSGWKNVFFHMTFSVMAKVRIGYSKGSGVKQLRMCYCANIGEIVFVIVALIARHARRGGPLIDLRVLADRP